MTHQECYTQASFDAIPLIQFIFELAGNNALLVNAKNLAAGKKMTFPKTQLDR